MLETFSPGLVSGLFQHPIKSTSQETLKYPELDSGQGDKIGFVRDLLKYQK